MASQNEQMVVNGRLITVQLVEGKTEAFITIGAAGSPNLPPAKISIKSFLEAGRSERQALQEVIQILAIAVRGATS